jgi:integrase
MGEGARIARIGAERRGERFADRRKIPHGFDAIVVVWLFAGLRSNELRRLERDCIRWEYSLLETNGEGVQPSICYLMVPTNKYKPEFRKPVAGEVGKALEAWLAVRPAQPPIIDPKTLHREDKLFAFADASSESVSLAV